MCPCPNFKISNKLGQTKSVTSYPLLVHLFIYLFVCLPSSPECRRKRVLKWIDGIHLGSNNLDVTSFALLTSFAFNLVTRLSSGYLVRAHSRTPLPRSSYCNTRCHHKFAQPKLTSRLFLLRPTDKICVQNGNEYI